MSACQVESLAKNRFLANAGEGMGNASLHSLVYLISYYVCQFTQHLLDLYYDSMSLLILPIILPSKPLRLNLA